MFNMNTFSSEKNKTAKTVIYMIVFSIIVIF